MDGPFCTFAEPRLRMPERRRGADDADAHSATACRRGVRPAAPHWRSLAFVAKDERPSSPAFVESSLAKPMAEQVFDSVSIVGGVFVMGMSILLP